MAETVELLTKKGWTYEKDGALWLNTTELLKEKFMREGKTQEQVDKLDLKDDVLRRANGFYTYFAADIAYHRNKLEVRGFDKAINIWGADHHGHVARLQAALDGLGLDGSHRLVVVLMQLVNLMQDGKPVRMSKRSGKAIALHDLLDEISVDAARYFFNSRASTSPLDFDLDLAVREDSENPVYYVQYAHARICSLVARLAEEGATVPAAGGGGRRPVRHRGGAGPDQDPGPVPRGDPPGRPGLRPLAASTAIWSTLAGDFHRFYNACRIKGEEPAVLSARLKLADTVRSVLANGLDLLGVPPRRRCNQRDEQNPYAPTPRGVFGHQGGVYGAGTKRERFRVQRDVLQKHRNLIIYPLVVLALLGSLVGWRAAARYR